MLWHNDMTNLWMHKKEPIILKDNKWVIIIQEDQISVVLFKEKRKQDMIAQIRTQLYDCIIQMPANRDKKMVPHC